MSGMMGKDLLKLNGKVEFKGTVSLNLIYTERTDIPFRRGDLIERTLKNGVKEVYDIDDPQNCHERHYLIHVHKK